MLLICSKVISAFGLAILYNWPTKFNEQHLLASSETMTFFESIKCAPTKATKTNKNNNYCNNKSNINIIVQHTTNENKSKQDFFDLKASFVFGWLTAFCKYRCTAFFQTLINFLANALNVAAPIKQQVFTNKTPLWHGVPSWFPMHLAFVMLWPAPMCCLWRPEVNHFCSKMLK